MFRPKILQMTAVALIVLGSAGAAYAGDRDNEIGEQAEMATALNANTTLAQAIATAEQKTGGKAVETSVQTHNGGTAYEIKIASGDTLQNVLIDANSGEVIKVMAVEGTQHEDGDYDGD
jgi:uncharacterized membrane protein YkoI